MRIVIETEHPKTIKVHVLYPDGGEVSATITRDPDGWQFEQYVGHVSIMCGANRTWREALNIGLSKLGVFDY